MWRKSTYSVSGNGQCVEVGTWRKASYSIANGMCVEVGNANPAVAVRDTVDRGGVELEFTRAVWMAFTSSL